MLTNYRFPMYLWPLSSDTPSDSSLIKRIEKIFPILQDGSNKSLTWNNSWTILVKFGFVKKSLFQNLLDLNLSNKRFNKPKNKLNNIRNQLKRRNNNQRKNNNPRRNNNQRRKSNKNKMMMLQRKNNKTHWICYHHHHSMPKTSKDKFVTLKTN